jgi:cytochrome P450
MTKDELHSPPEDSVKISQFDHVRPVIGADGTPYGYYRAIRDLALEQEQMVHWCESNDGFWLVLGHKECVEIARLPEAFSNREPTLPRYATDEPFMIAAQDDPEHRIARALVNRPFNPVGVRQYEDSVRENVNLLVDGIIADGSADLAKVIAKPIPAMVTALIMGLPAEEGPKFSRWVADVAEGHLIDPEAAAKNIAEMYAYFDETVRRHRANPGTDILSYVINAEVDGRTFNEKELKGFCTLLMVGGIDNTYRLIASMLCHLGRDHDLRRKLVNRPDLIPSSVQEFLRYYSPACNSRLVTRDIEIHGVKMKAGDMVLNANPIANRDPREFDRPDKFIVDRLPNNHLGLGIGVHRCLGAHLITLEAKLVLEEFLRRMPEYEVDEDVGPTWAPGFIAGMSSVPVKFTPGKPAKNSEGRQRAAVQAWLDNARSA